MIPRRFLPWSVMAAILVGSLVAAPSSSSASHYYFGTLDTVDAHVQDEHNAGVETAEIDVSWAAYEPQDGVFDQNYANSVKARVQHALNAGQKVTLGTSIHYIPNWIYNYAGSEYIDQDGHRPQDYGLWRATNSTFSNTVRRKIEQYFDRLDADLGFKNMWTVRVQGSVDTGELLYPQTTGGQTARFWAYDTNAQGGSDLPNSFKLGNFPGPNPMPGWKPGQTSWNGQTVTTAMAQKWLDWYIGGLDDLANWQMQYIKAKGYTGFFQELTPGEGTHPDGYTNAINHLLNVGGDGTTGRAAVWHKFYEQLPDKQNAVIYISSLADGSGGNDTCQSGDTNFGIDPGTYNPGAQNGWSAARWEALIGHKLGMPINGENPGGSFSRSAGLAELNATAAQMASCGMQGMYWAHSFHIWDGSAGFTIQDYGNLIHQYNTAPAPTPTPTGIVHATATPSVQVTATPVSGTSVDDASMVNGQNLWYYQGANWSHCTSCSVSGGGLYQSGNSWDATANEAAIFQFTGTRVDYYGVKDAHHGIAGISVDDGPETAVDLYAATRAEDVLLWTSPTLSSGTHWLRIRVTGTHSAVSTDDVVAIDRAVVH